MMHSSAKLVVFPVLWFRMTPAIMFYYKVLCMRLVVFNSGVSVLEVSSSVVWAVPYLY